MLASLSPTGSYAAHSRQSASIEGAAKPLVSESEQPLRLRLLLRSSLHLSQRLSAPVLGAGTLGYILSPPPDGGEIECTRPLLKLCFNQGTGATEKWAAQPTFQASFSFEKLEGPWALFAGSLALGLNLRTVLVRVKDI